jgi:hypothetical protein
MPAEQIFVADIGPQFVALDPVHADTDHDAVVQLGTAASDLKRQHAGRVAHYNLCRDHESLGTKPAVQLGITDRVWSLSDLIDAALAVAARTRPKLPRPKLPLSVAASSA